MRRMYKQVRHLAEPDNEPKHIGMPHVDLKVMGNVTSLPMFANVVTPLRIGLDTFAVTRICSTPLLV